MSSFYGGLHSSEERSSTPSCGLEPVKWIKTMAYWSIGVTTSNEPRVISSCKSKLGRWANSHYLDVLLLHCFWIKICLSLKVSFYLTASIKPSVMTAAHNEVSLPCFPHRSLDFGQSQRFLHDPEMLDSSSKALSFARYVIFMFLWEVDPIRYSAPLRDFNSPDRRLTAFFPILWGMLL